MGKDLGSDPILQRGDNTTPVGIILRVGRKDELYIKWEADLEPAYLHIPFFQDVEEGHLYA